MNNQPSLVGWDRARALHHADDCEAFRWGVSELRKQKGDDANAIAEIICDQLNQWTVSNGPH
jgi:hypothetical protein